MATVASKVPFHQFAVLLEKIQGLSGSDAKKKLLKDFLDEWRAFDAKLHSDDPTQPDTFFPAMRLLLPQLDRDREAYGIKEHTLAKLYIELLGLGKDSPAAQKLLNYRAPSNAKGDAGDFASVAYWVLKPRCAEQGTLKLADINDCLDGIARCNAAKDKDGVRRHLLHALRNTSAKEQKWLIRIIMKELKMGLSQASVLGVFHEDAEDLYNVKMSLDKVCTMLKDPAARLHEIEIALFSPFRPMLGDRAAPNKIEQLMNNRPFFVEIKFDGERMQLHKNGNEYKYFSRGGNEYTHVYGADDVSGNFTQYVAASFKSTVKSCIIDGEMVGYNPNTKTIGSKGENFDIKSLTTASGYQPMMCVFDILECNGVVLSNRTLRERRRVLDDLFNPVEGRIVLSEYAEKHTRQDCADALNDAIDRREEGIMVKNPDSPYQPAKRTGGWYKIKPEYVLGLMDELDVLVVGGFFGVGSRSHMMSHFLCAVAVPPSTAAASTVAVNDKPTKFYTFCKVGSGYSRSELHEFNRRLAEHWTVFDKKSAPDWLELAPGFKQRPDAYIEPEKSAILQIKAAEIVDSDQYRTGCTLRFPRVEKIRDDREWHSCMTTVDIETLRQKSSGKLAGQYADGGEGGGEDKPKRKRTKVSTATVKPTVDAKFRGIDASAVEKISDAFTAKEFCVVSGSTTLSKTEAERRLLELGATVVQNPSQDTYCVLADKSNLRLRNIIGARVYDVVRVDWLARCVREKRLIAWTPADMIHSAPRTASSFSGDYDRHGDSYYDDVSVDELKTIFARMPNVEKRHFDSSVIAELEMKHFPHDSARGLFRLCRVYLDNCVAIGDQTTKLSGSSLDLVGLELRLAGATLAEGVTEDVSHVVVDVADLSRMDLLRYCNRCRAGKRFHVVSAQWVYDSIEKGKLLQERSYEPE